MARKPPSALIFRRAGTFAALLTGAFLVLSTLLPWTTALRIVVSVPFLYILPGWCVVRAFFPTRDRIEAAALAVLLSYAMTSFGIFLAEEATLRLAAWHMIAAVLGVNVLALATAVAAQRRDALRSLATRLATYLYRKFYKRNNEESEDKPDAAEDRKRLRSRP